MHNFNIKLQDREIDLWRKGQHCAESKSLSAFVRDCVRQRLTALGLTGATQSSVEASSFEDEL